MGSLRALFDPLFDLLGAMLQEFHALGAPWWLSIALLTVVVRTLLFPLTVRQVRSMRKLQLLQPELDEIRERHKDDPRKQQEETFKFYGESKTNPLGGCLPALVQLPIFVVLYYTIKEFEGLESFRTGGLFWFQDLTAADPFFVLPVLYVATMMAAQEVIIRRTAPQQKGLMRAMPLVFGLFLALGGFPSGLFVYWVTSNTITLCQNLILYRDKPTPEKGAEPKAPSLAPPLTAPRDDATASPGRRRRRKSRRR
ncbi:membrane protein insertase YidC [Rubrobacter marinus]|uniref:Membrane protein insertase YidC n=1 Tax=Rubrobacter marinus TaxID=2653852 RepID=A0A6G8PUU0_9ACTN|nr:membrane protein insertase YidC [Rubrobacter marinus]QIN77946.1 membrane protein insertase YidC [Rubrobacter marinus]